MPRVRVTTPEPTVDPLTLTNEDHVRRATEQLMSAWPGEMEHAVVVVRAKLSEQCTAAGHRCTALCVEQWLSLNDIDINNRAFDTLVKCCDIGVDESLYPEYVAQRLTRALRAFSWPMFQEVAEPVRAQLARRVAMRRLGRTA